MNNPANSVETPSAYLEPPIGEMMLEVAVVPVSDVDRAKRFYASLGWRLDLDFAASDGYRVVQFTPPASSCSIMFGEGITTTPPGSVEGLHLIVADVEATCRRVHGQSEALTAGYQRFKLDSFLVTQIDPAEHAAYFSRDLNTSPSIRASSP